MLYLQFYVKNNRYAIAAKDVVAVVPLVSLHSIPKVPEFIAGLMNYHGDSVPVVDMTMLIEGRKTNQHLSTRIVLVVIETKRGERKLVGLMAEKLTEVMRINEQEFQNFRVNNKDAEYLGDVLTDHNGLLQRLSVSDILPAETQELLYQ